MTERTAKLAELCIVRGKESKPSHFGNDYHTSALTLYKDLPHWEKLARAMAYAISNQDVWVYDDDRIGGRIFYNREEPIAEMCAELDAESGALEAFREECPYCDELFHSHVLSDGAYKGHITWFYDRILSLGVEGFKAQYENALAFARDEKASEFYRGVIILLDAMLEFNDKHIAEYEKLGNYELAALMKKVPRKPAETFREAVQAFYMQHLVVMRENPYGGNSPGRLDYYLWPYLERDIANGRCTLEEAREIIDELFTRFEERLYGRDGWVEAIVVGGTYPNGASAVNPLTYIMIESIAELNLTHPSVYVRLPKDPSDELLSTCARYFISGNNRAQIFYDPAVIDAMVKNGTPYRDAVEYACGGCMEVSAQGMTSDLLYAGWQNCSKILELAVTGGECLKTGKRFRSMENSKSLTDYEDFESFYSGFIAEADRFMKLYLRLQDIFSKYSEVNRPSYLISSMIDDCMTRGRNMHGGGARYHDYGMTPLGLPSVADGLFAIKKAVFEEKICSASTFIDALKANFEGYEQLRTKLRSYPKYGMDNDEADALAARLMSDYSDLLLNYRTRHGGIGKPVILTFWFSPTAAADLGATPDGRFAGSLVAHGITPHSGSMREGVTAAINSCSKMPFDKFAGGASTMWDFDAHMAKEDIIKAILKTFIEKKCQIFQGNMTDGRILLEAKAHPEDHQNLVVRVGGYSARFVNLPERLQNDVISRFRHTK